MVSVTPKFKNPSARFLFGLCVKTVSVRYSYFRSDGPPTNRESTLLPLENLCIWKVHPQTGQEAKLGRNAFHTASKPDVQAHSPRNQDGPRLRFRNDTLPYTDARMWLWLLLLLSCCCYR